MYIFIHNVLQTGRNLHDINIDARFESDVTICATNGPALRDGETKQFRCRNGTVGRFITIRRNTDTTVRGEGVW